MNRIFEHNGTDVTLYNATSIFSGYGHQKIIVTLEYKGYIEEFTAITDNMPKFDEACDLKDEDYDQYQMALYNIIAYNISEDVQDWLESIDTDK